LLLLRVSAEIGVSSTIGENAVALEVEHGGARTSFLVLNDLRRCILTGKNVQWEE
jgi:hypothetical protein